MRVLLISPPPGGGTSRLRIGEEPARLWIALLEWNECFSFVPHSPSVTLRVPPPSRREAQSRRIVWRELFSRGRSKNAPTSTPCCVANHSFRRLIHHCRGPPSPTGEGKRILRFYQQFSAVWLLFDF